jgi:hypothetical protein
MPLAMMDNAKRPLTAPWNLQTTPLRMFVPLPLSFCGRPVIFAWKVLAAQFHRPPNAARPSTHYICGRGTVCCAGFQKLAEGPGHHLYPVPLHKGQSGGSH